MTRKDEPPVFIRLSPLQVKKIDLAKEIILEPVTTKDVIEGLIDNAFLVAIKTLYKQRRISKKDYRDCLRLIPDYPQNSQVT